MLLSRTALIRPGPIIYFSFANSGGLASEPLQINSRITRRARTNTRKETAHLYKGPKVRTMYKLRHGHTYLRIDLKILGIALTLTNTLAQLNQPPQ